MALSANFRLMCWDCAVAWGMDLLLHRGISQMSLRSALIEKASPAYVLLNRTGKNIEAVLAAKIGPMATTHTPPPQTHFEGRRGFMIGNSRMKPIWKNIRSMEQERLFPPSAGRCFRSPSKYLTWTPTTQLAERKSWPEGVQLGCIIPYQPLHYREKNVRTNSAKNVQRSNLPKSSHLFSALLPDL